MIKWFQNKHHLKYNWVGYVAAFIAIGGLIAQIEQIYSRKSANDLSYIHIGSRIIILLMWLVYGFINRIPPTIFSGITGLILTSIILGLKIHYQNNNKKENNTKQIYTSNKEDVDPKLWGPKFWDLMHTFSYKYSNNPTQEEKQEASNFYNSIIKLVPCNICKISAIEYIKNNPVNTNNKNSLINWVLDFHNDINIKLNKVTWTREQLDKKYL